MYISFGAMSLGLAWWLLSGAPGGTSSASKVLPLDQITRELFSGNPLALLNLGVLLLLITPGITLLVQIITYALASNWRFVRIACAVGAVLALSLLLALR